MAESLVQQHYSRRPERTLFHYTSSEGLYGIIESGALWTTRIQYLNDAKEFAHAVNIAQSEIRRLASAAPESEALLYERLHKRAGSMNGARTFIFSLSEEPDLLSQWRAYCRGGGFSIGFDHTRLLQLASNQEYRLLPCVYDESHQRELIKEVIQESVSRYKQGTFEDEKNFITDEVNDFYGRFMLLATSMKHPSFAEEREWRLIGGPFSYDHERAGWRPGKGLLIPYHELILSTDEQDPIIKKIYVGPSSHRDESRDSLGWYLRNRGKLPINDRKIGLVTSETPYRSEWP